MDTEEIFRVLEIDITKNEELIKQAYRKKLSVTNPEDNPEGFKRLRQAYEAACAYARQQEREPQEEKEDTTPSGLWVKKAKEIYSDISRRRDKEEWKALFEEDIFQSLEGEEECREKLLAFMLANYYLPTEVWEILNEKLKIVDDRARLKEIFPGDFINFIVNKCQRGEDIDFNLLEGPKEGRYDEYIQYYLRCWNAVDDGNIALAEQMIGEAQALGIYHPVMDVIQANIYAAKEEKEKAVEYLAQTYEKYPNDLTISYNYGDLCWKQGYKDRAAEVFLKIKENNNEHYMSNVYLTEWYYQKGEYEKAKECGEKVMSAGGGDNFYQLIHEINEKLMERYKSRYLDEDDVEAALELGWCYLQNDMYFQGIKLAESVAQKIPADKKASHQSLLTKLYLEEAMYEEALSSALLWRQYLKEKMEHEEGEDLEADKHRMYQTYAIRVNAYHQMGFAKKEYYEDALKEIQALAQIEEPGVHVLMEQAQIYVDSGEPEKCIEIADKLIDDKQVYGAHALLLQAYTKLRDAGGVINASQACVHYFPAYAKGYEEVAKVYHDLDRPEDLKQVLEQARQNDVKSPILEAYEFQMHNKPPESPSFKERLEQLDRDYKKPLSRKMKIKYYEEGYPLLTQMLYEYPSNYMLIDRGLFSMAAQKMEEAKADFKKVLENNPAEQFALNNLGCIYKYTEEYERAIVCFKRAIRYMDEEPNSYPYGNLGHTYERMGEYALAAQVLMQMQIRFHTNYPETINDLICDYARSGQLDKSLELAENNRKNTQWVSNEVRYYAKRFEAFKDANELSRAGMELSLMEKAFEKLPAEERSRERNFVLRKKAWYQLVIGQYDEAVANMKKIIADNQKTTHIPSEELYEEILFMLSMKEYASSASGSQGEEKTGRFSQLFKKKKNQEEELTDKEYAERLLQRHKSLTDEVQGNRYFYRGRYAGWMYFIGKLFSDTTEAAEEAFHKMQACMRCRMCNDPACINMSLAKALLLEKQGKRSEAIEVYRAMQELHPYDWYSKAKLYYLGEK